MLTVGGAVGGLVGFADAQVLEHYRAERDAVVQLHAAGKVLL